MQNNITQLPDDAIVFDSETTGFDPETGDRIVELGAVKLKEGLPTKETFHLYINPGRSVPQDAVNVHGLTTEFLSAFEPIEKTIHGFLDFVGDLPMIAHNAAFDSKFLNFELAAMGMPIFPEDRFYDSLKVARRLYPGASASLDALCKRHNVSLADRGKHGALIDSQLLAEVIVEMNGGRQTSLFGDVGPSTGTNSQKAIARDAVDTFIQRASPEELKLHAELVAKLGENPIWDQVSA